MSITHEVDVCIAGGGPAGMLLGLLLAAMNVRTLVLEQHHDFQREYRGEVLMPRFASLFDQLGLLDYMESYPCTRLEDLIIRTPKRILTRFPMRRLSGKYPFALWMPQPIFLDALYQKAKLHACFDLWFNATADRLMEAGGKTNGLIVRRNGEEVRVAAKVTVGVDGRTSRVRKLGGFEMAFEQHDFDVVWFSLPRPENFPHAVQLMFANNRPYIVAPKHPDLVQCGLLVSPGQFTELRRQGVPAMQTLLREGPAEFQPFADSLQDFKPFFLLQAMTSQVKNWAQDGLLLIGDAAHTCSPLGAIGVSMALATAAVAADVIAEAMLREDFSAAQLAKVQQLRRQDVDTVQSLQRRAGRLLAIRNPLALALRPYLFPLAVRSGLAQNVLKTLTTHDARYPLSESLRHD